MIPVKQVEINILSNSNFQHQKYCQNCFCILIPFSSLFLLTEYGNLGAYGRDQIDDAQGTDDQIPSGMI